MPRQIPTIRKLAYTAVMLLLVVMVCEAAVRVRAWIRYGSPETGVRDPMLVYDPAADLYVPRPGYEVKGARIHIRINALGFRGDEFTRQKPPHTVRIACLGASTTFCAEASSNRTTWPHRLQERLSAAHPDVVFEVVNAAVGGYVAADSLKNLRHRVLPLDPDLVIYYEANNEIVSDTRELADREGLLADSSAPPAITLLSKYSLLVDLAYKNLAIAARSRNTAERKLDRIPRNLPDRFLGVIGSMREELARRHMPLLLSTFLVKYRRGQDRRTQIANADVAFYYMPWMSIDGLLDVMDVYNEALVRYAGANGLPIVDDREAIPADGAHYADCMHLNDGGSDAMADRFFRYLRDSRLLEPAIARARGEASREAPRS